MGWDLGSIATKRARLTPNKLALIYEDTPVTYGKLNECTNRAAHYSQKLGLKKGDRICVFLLNCPSIRQVVLVNGMMVLWPQESF